MANFKEWLLESQVVESIGRIMNDDVDRQVRVIIQQALQAIPQVMQSQTPMEIGRISGKRQDTTGATKRWLRTVVVTYKPEKQKSKGWDNAESMKLFLNAPSLTKLDFDEIYNSMAHELAHITDPNAGELQHKEFDPNNQDQRLQYMKQRHEFDAFLAMTTNWIMRSANPQQLSTILQSLKTGRGDGLPPDLMKVVEWMMKMDQGTKNKFLSRVGQAVQMKQRGEVPSGMVAPAPANAPNMPIPTPSANAPQQQVA